MENLKRKINDYYNEDKFSKKFKDEELIPLTKKSLEMELEELDTKYEREMHIYEKSYETERERKIKNHILARNKIISRHNNIPEQMKSPNISEDSRKPRIWDIEKNQNSFEDGKYACMCISIIAIQYFLRDENIPLEFEWEEIIKKGIAIYKIWHHLFKKTNDYSYPHAYEVYNILKSKNIHAGISLKKDMGGHLIDNQVENCNMPKNIQDLVYREEFYTPSFSTVDQSISEMLNTSNSAIAFTINDYTISICHSKYDSYKGIWLYDSHIDQDNPKPDHSSLYLFPSKIELVKYIKRKHHNAFSKREDINIFHSALFHIQE
jgi:hypothetical protein